jgi:hypothetical protein
MQNRISRKEEKGEGEEKEEPEISKAVRERIRILNTNKSTLKSHIDERAIVRGRIKKFYDIIREKSAVNGKYLPWINTSSPIDSDDASPIDSDDANLPIDSVDANLADSDDASRRNRIGRKIALALSFAAFRSFDRSNWNDDYEASSPPPEAFAESVAGGMDNVSIVIEKISVLPHVEEKKISRPDTPKPSTNIIQDAEDHAAAEEEGCP